MGNLSPVIYTRRLQQLPSRAVEAAHEAQAEARAGDGPQRFEIYARPGGVAEKADGFDLTRGGPVLQDGEPVVVHGRAAEEGVGPHAPRLFQQVWRGAGDEVGAEEELALGPGDVSRGAGELLVVVRAVVEDEPGVEAGDEIQRRPRGRVGNDDGPGTRHLGE